MSTPQLHDISIGFAQVSTKAPFGIVDLGDVENPASKYWEPHYRCLPYTDYSGSTPTTRNAKAFVYRARNLEEAKTHVNLPVELADHAQLQQWGLNGDMVTYHLVFDSRAKAAEFLALDYDEQHYWRNKSLA